MAVAHVIAALLRLSRKALQARMMTSSFLRWPQSQHILQVGTARPAERLGQHVGHVAFGADDAQLE
eukprot:16451072-Heterocapsa_arctica.AAC.1